MGERSNCSSQVGSNSFGMDEYFGKMLVGCLGGCVAGGVVGIGAGVLWVCRLDICGLWAGRIGACFRMLQTD